MHFSHPIPASTNSRKRFFFWVRLGLFLAFLALVGCAQRMTVRLAEPLMEHGVEVISEESDPGLAEAAMASSLKLLEAAIRADRKNSRLLLMACRGYSGYALLFVPEGEDARARVFYERARNYGLRALEADRRFAGLEQMPLEKLEEVIIKCGRKDVPRLFWCAFAWGYWINLSRDKPAALAQLPKVEAIMKRVLALDETYFFGGPHLFFGTIYGSRTRMLGGDPDKAREHFDRNLSINGGRFLLAYYFYARYLAVQSQDRELFERMLRKVTEASPDLLPEQRLVNEVARKRAAELLARVDDYF